MFTENEPGGDAPLSEEEAGKDLQVPAFADPDAPTAEEAKAAVEVARSALAQKKHWRGKAIDPETGKQYSEIVPDLRKKITSAPPKSEEVSKQVIEDVATLKQAEDKRQFGHAHSLSPEETDAVFSFAKGNGLTNTKALEHSFVKSGIEAMRVAARNADNTPGPSGRLPKVEGKTFFELDEKGRRENFASLTKGLQKR